MKVVFFSESSIIGKVDRTFPNARNDIAWSIMMDADWCPYGVKPSGNYDLGVVTIPKTKPNLKVAARTNRKPKPKVAPKNTKMAASIDNDVNDLIKELDRLLH